jgi:tRNA threonylcarbamoyl adenosine modification protein (Sua5/YciO/YrdC/YwlC family)
MSARYDCADPVQLLQGITQAELALRRGELVVLPTDTVYGIAAEAFDPVAVDGLLKAKGRGRDMPPPVLVGTVRAAMALVMDLADTGKDLIDEFWPGGLTLVCRASPTLVWDLGETKGTVAVRMPLHQVALELLKKTGPLAVSSANVSGQPPATTADEAVAQLGDSVSVYLDAGPCPGDVPSTIVDLTGSVPRLLRRGVISVDRLQEVVPLAIVDDVDSDDVDSDVVPEDVPDVVPERAPDVSPEQAPEEIPEDFAGDAGVADEAGGVAPDEVDEAQVARGMAPGDSSGAQEGPADQVKPVHRDATE